MRARFRSPITRRTSPLGASSADFVVGLLLPSPPCRWLERIGKTKYAAERLVERLRRLRGGLPHLAMRSNTLHDALGRLRRAQGPARGCPFAMAMIRALTGASKCGSCLSLKKWRIDNRSKPPSRDMLSGKRGGGCQRGDPSRLVRSVTPSK
jgi:hypothetical protein